MDFRGNPQKLLGSFAYLRLPSGDLFGRVASFARCNLIPVYGNETNPFCDGIMQFLSLPRNVTPRDITFNVNILSRTRLNYCFSFLIVKYYFNKFFIHVGKYINKEGVLKFESYKLLGYKLLVEDKQLCL